MKAQITKAVKLATKNSTGIPALAARKAAISVFAKHMPREQAKHAARKYLTARAV